MADTIQDKPEEQNPILKQVQQRTASSPTTAIIPEAQTMQGEEKIPVPETKAPVRPETLPTMLDAIQQGIGVGTEYAREVIEAKETAANLNSKLARVTKEKAKDDLVIQQQQQQAILKAEQDAQRVFEAGGGVDNLIELNKGKLAAQQEVLKTQAMVSEAKEKWNPFQKYFGMGEVIERANIAEATLAKYNKAIQNTTANANNIDVMLDNMKSTRTDATLAASSRQMLKQAMIDATKFEVIASDNHAIAAQTALNMNDRNINLRVKQFELTEQALDREDVRAARQAQRQELEKSAKFDDTFVQGVRKGRVRQGLAVADPADPVAMEQEEQEILVSRKTKGAARVAVDEAFDVGVGITRPTYYQTMRSRLRMAPSTLTDGKNRALTFFKDKTDESLVQLQAAREETGVKGKIDESTLSNTVNSGMGAAWKKAEAEIISTDTENPNHAPPLGELIKTSPELQRHRFIQEELLPLFSDPDAPVEDLSVEKVLELGAASIKTKTHPERKYTFNEVDQAIGALYRRAAVYNTDSQGRQDFSFPLQTTYKAKLKGINAFKFSPLSFGGFEIETKDNVVDLMDGVQRRKMLLRMLTGAEKGIGDIGPTLFKGLIGIEESPEDILPEGSK